MTLDMLFLVVVPVYLVLVAYGQVGARRRGLRPRLRMVAGALRVALPPLALAGALLSTGDPYLFRAWIFVVIGMAVAGAIVAALVELVAPKVGA